MDERPTQSRGPAATYILAAVITIVVLPFLILGIGLFEELVIGTHETANICKSLGIFEPLEDLLDGIERLFTF